MVKYQQFFFKILEAFLIFLGKRLKQIMVRIFLFFGHPESLGTWNKQRGKSLKEQPLMFYKVFEFGRTLKATLILLRIFGIQQTFIECLVCQVFQQNVYQLLLAAAFTVLPSFQNKAVNQLLFSVRCYILSSYYGRSRSSSLTPFSLPHIFPKLGRPQYIFYQYHINLVRAVVSDHINQVS